MDRSPDPLFVSGSGGQTHPWTKLRPQADDHVAISRRGILDTASPRNSRRTALVLGAGRCEEVPLAELAAQFERVHLVDSDEEALLAGMREAGLSGSTGDRVAYEVADLTGVSASFLAAAETLSLSQGTFARWHDALVELATQTQPRPFAPQAHGEAGNPAVGYDLIVASCVLCQLHVAVATGIASLVAERFSKADAAALHASNAWTEALQSLARRMEATFVDSLALLLAPEGRIYFSDTVQVCFIHYLPGGEWGTPGTYRLTRTTDLADYLDRRFEVERLGEWSWVVKPPRESGQIGRLFRVQGLRLRLATSS
ncbi:MAG: hypothetical protein KF708_04855 [Pirellulales bacterium]|nr:hypothetical protein [Pirellulales bacterium]